MKFAASSEGWETLCMATSFGPTLPQCVHQLFEEQVARTPDAVAITALKQANSGGGQV
jgi:hypothetical protein